jgi:hypothetical protein
LLQNPAGTQLSRTVKVVVVLEHRSVRYAKEQSNLINGIEIQQVQR